MIREECAEGCGGAGVCGASFGASELHPVKFTLEISKLLFVSCFSGGRAPQKNQLAIERYSNGAIAFNFLCKRLLL